MFLRCEMSENDIFNRNTLTEAEYQKILSFLLEIKSPYSKIQTILHCLNKYFGSTCSAFWFVKDDFSLVNPIGSNINPKLLMDYESELYRYDEFRLDNIDSNILLHENVLEYDSYVNKSIQTPYTNRLNEENIRHKYSLILRSNGKITGAIALFERANVDKEQLKFSAHCLEVIAPLIAQELANQTIINQTEKIMCILQTVLNTSETGIAIFDRSDVSNIIYYNHVCIKYCFEFIDTGHPSTIISDFIRSVIDPLNRPYPHIKGVSLELPSRNGDVYRVHIIDNCNQSENICTLLLTRKTVGRADVAHESLFSQLTPKEREITLLIAQGLTNYEIADRLFISVSTVKSHIQHIPLV